MRVTVSENIEIEVITVCMDFRSGNWTVAYVLRFPFGFQKTEHYVFDRNAMNGIHGTPEQIINGLCDHLRGRLKNAN